MGDRLLDLLPAFRRTPARTLWADPADMHPNRLAQRRAAEVIAPRLVALRDELAREGIGPGGVSKPRPATTSPRSGRQAGR